MHLLSTFALASVALVVACDAPTEPGPDDRGMAGANDAQGEQTSGDDSGSESGSESGEPEAEPLDNLAGSACDAWGLARACGAEILVEGEETVEAGMQFCAVNPSVPVDDRGDWVWGTCLLDIDCNPEEEDGVCDGVEDILCELSIMGEPRIVSCDDEGEGGTTPLVLAFDGDAVRFEPARASSGFDIDGAGRCDSHDWPSAATPWLAADLDGNGSIDGGAELFGSGTVLDGGGKATDGFIALAQFDSNRDGVVSEADARWGELVLWSDLDRDKRTDAGELEPLSAYGVSQLPLAYARERECDGRRNCAVEQAAFEFKAASGALAQGRLVDVHLPCR